ncbi:hypothetical protein E6O75_ATG02023 [Venturia nashicola]|uniref:Uncharacterized protein n=1 Tax=Venturia nashicola TaxID=86259 RepID=A0A4Z1P7Q8_9PEZI|nr:hypothetical protein E6O75_ATG02023 [Venturia nashicola]
MQLQTLLPVILFAQSSFAYFCCVELKGLSYYSAYLSNDDKYTWNPYPQCEVKILRKGPNCGTWDLRATASCAAVAPITHVGVTESFHCQK